MNDSDLRVLLDSLGDALVRQQCALHRLELSLAMSNDLLDREQLLRDMHARSRATTDTIATLQENLQ